jgi:tellurite methyltransferase
LIVSPHPDKEGVRMNAREKWNHKYSERLIHDREPLPNPRLERLASYLHGGTAYDLACGLGGNSLFLAKRNYQVEAIDISEVAIDYVEKLAEKNQVSIQPRVCDISDASFLKSLQGQADVVVVTYYLDRQLFPVLRDLLKVGGYLFIETYYLSEMNETNGVSERFKLQPKELLTVFSDWNVQFFEENEEEGRQTIFCQKIK